LSFLVRGIGLINKLKTHCPKGHKLKEPNLDRYSLSHGSRTCKTCKNDQQRLRWHRVDVQIYNKQSRLKRKDKIQGHNKNWKILHPKYHDDWQKNNREKMRGYSKKYESNNKEERNQKNKNWRKNNPTYQNQWRKNNPRSSPSYSLELQDAMNNVRLRDKNTCQWQGCGLTFRQAPIQVHHIFPRKEYPELELVEQYLICYCMNHHWLWHKYRGDPCARLISHNNKISIMGLT